MIKCKTCLLELPESEFRKINSTNRGKQIGRHCKKCYATYMREWRDNHKQQVNRMGRERWHKKRAVDPQWINSERERQVKRLRDNKKRVIEHYGGKCVECGISELKFLTLDHVNGGGREDRKKNGNHQRLYAKLIREQFKTDVEYQILCWNHNCAKHII